MSALTIGSTPKETAAPESVKGAIAYCPAGQHAVSGGGSLIVGRGGLNSTTMSGDHLSWFVIGINEGVSSGQVEAFVLCAGAGQAVAASAKAVRAQHARATAEVEALTAQLAAKYAASKR